jgi:integrase
MPGTAVRVRGIKRYRARGNWFCYHRATGKRITETFGSASFFTRLAELDKEANSQAELAARPGTLKALILDYKQTDPFHDLAPRTKFDYEKVFAFLEPLWNSRITAFTTPEIVKLRDKWRKARGREFVNKARAVLSILMGRAVELGIIASNPVRDVKQVRRPRDARVINRAWTLAERKAALKHLPTQLRLPVAIGLYSGMRVADILRLPPTAIEGGRIRVQTAKRGVWIYIPIPPALRAALHNAPTTKDAEVAPIRLCLNAHGRAWTNSGFSCSFRRAIADLWKRGLVGDGLTFHGLRHTVASALAECDGVSSEDIAAVLGQKSSQMAAHYSREADRSRRTAATIAKYRPLDGK